MNANGRRCRQFKHGFKHISGRGRPVYRSAAEDSITAAIDRERKAARRMAAAKGKK